LKLDDIDYESHILNVWDFKNDKPRRAPASEASIRRIKQYCSSTRTAVLTPAELSAGFIFPQRGRATLRTHLNRRLKSECRRMGMPVITSHSFRHCAATHMLKKGAGIRQVQAMLGHEKISTTQIYTRVITEDLKNLVAEFHPREAAV
jgi:integrase/recombinase XerD